MIRAALIGIVAGQRAMTPLALVADAAERGMLPADSGAPGWLGHKWVAQAADWLAVAELAGDKWRGAPDRTVASGLIARATTGALAAVALSPRPQRVPAALIGAVAAVGSSFIGLAAREAAMRRVGQFASGAAEDAAVVSAGAAIVRGAA